MVKKNSPELHPKWVEEVKVPKFKEHEDKRLIKRKIQT